MAEKCRIKIFPNTMPEEYNLTTKKDILYNGAPT